MKKILCVLGVAAIVAGCQEAKVETVEPVTGTPFKLTAVIQQDTKTTFTPDYANKIYKVEWEDNEQVGVYSQYGGTDPVAFTRNTETGAFECADFSPASYLHVIYPYDPDINFSSGDFGQTTTTYTIGSDTDYSQTQDGIGNDGSAQSHIQAPLVGWISVSDVASGKSVSMYHITTLLDVQLVNTTEEAITVSKVTVTTSEGHDLVGKYYLSPWYARDGAGDTGLVQTEVEGDTSDTAILKVSNGTVGTGETGHFYLITAPFTIAANATLTVTLTTDKGDYTKTAGRDQAIAMSFGKVNHIVVSQKDETAVYTYSKLNLTEAMLSSPYVMSNDGQGFSALVANTGEDYWHSYWYDPGTLTLDTTYGHYIDISLDASISNFFFRYQNRISGNNGYPKTIIIAGTNDSNAIGKASQEEGGSSWVRLATYDSGLHTGSGEWGALPVIVTDTPYQYLRFGIPQSNFGDNTKGFAGASLSGFEIYVPSTSSASAE